MQVPYQDSFHFQRIRPPNNFQWRPNFMHGGPRSRPPLAHWRQLDQDFSNSNEFWCEICDRGFRTAEILEKHKQQHQKCNIDGCQFIAHPKVITKHIQMQHASGLYNKIAKLQDPEEIKKWREERKKKYPTKDNVEKAAAAIKEKIDRGEKMGLKNNRHEKNFKTSHADKRKPYGNKKNQSKRWNNISDAKLSNSKKIASKSTDKKLPATEETRKLKPFAGIQDLMIDVDEDEQQEENDCGFSIEDEDELAITPLQETSGTVCQALTSLLCNYGSSDEEECDKNKTSLVTNTMEKDKPLPQNGNQKLNLATKNESDYDSGPEEVKVIKEIMVDPVSNQTKPVIQKRKLKSDTAKKQVFKRPKHKLPSTLLQKLLFKEIRQERNIVLQCIRHIVRNNFFEKSVQVQD